MFVYKSSALSPGETETTGMSKDWRRRKEGLTAQVVTETHMSNRATLNKSFKPNKSFAHDLVHVPIAFQLFPISSHA